MSEGVRVRKECCVACACVSRHATATATQAQFGTEPQLYEVGVVGLLFVCVVARVRVCVCVCMSVELRCVAKA